MQSAGKKYRFAKCLGSGAFAEVYLVEDRAGQKYACKTSGQAELLAKEAEFQRAAEHPLFPSFFDFWQENGRGYILMEYVPGENLAVILRREGPFPDRQAAKIGCRLAEGLGYLHEGQRPLVFRDVKPSNVMLTPEGAARLLDFGCVCPVGRNIDRAGTRKFSAPEQFLPGGRQTAAADVYGLGKTLQALTGERTGGLLKRITDRCIRQNPEERISNMRELGELLRLCADGGRVKIGDRQAAVLKGEIKVLQDIYVW